MKINVKKSELMKALTVVEKIVPTKTPLNVLKGILFETDGKKTSLVTNNMEFAVKSTIIAEIEDQAPGKIIFPTKIADIIRNLPDEDVEIEIEDERATVRCHKSVFKLNCMDAEEYPELSKYTPEWQHIKFPATKFKNILNKVLFAVGNDESKPAFNNVLLEMNLGILTVIASDTYRLAKVMDDTETDDTCRILVPGKSLMFFNKVIEDKEEVNIDLFISEREMVAKYECYTFYFRLVDEKYPDLSGVFPTDFTTKGKISADKLEKLLNRAALVAERNTTNFKIQEDKICISAESDMGKMSEEMDIEKIGDDLEIYLNGSYVKDILKVAKETVEINFNGPLGPCVLTQDNWQYLVLPIKVEKAGAETTA